MKQKDRRFWRRSGFSTPPLGYEAVDTGSADDYSDTKDESMDMPEPDPTPRIKKVRFIDEV